MMISRQNLGALAEKFLNNQLSESERKALQESLQANANLKQEWDELIHLLRLLEKKRQHEDLRTKMQSAKAAMSNKRPDPAKMGKNKRFLRKFGLPLGIASSLILASSSLTYLLMSSTEQQKGAEYMLLRREVETIKHSQSQILDSIKGKEAREKGATTPVFGGTGFAVSNNGYFATNYHVVKDAASVFIQTAEGESLPAYLVAFDPKADVALLKVEDPNFHFEKSNLPYVLANKPSELGQRVFSIGYPQEDLVYNEGYISSEIGFQRDSSSYQLEMVANPGQSGAPVLDAQGHVIALITGKQSNTSGKTYAVQSSALLALIQSLPNGNAIAIPQSNKLQKLERTQQVKKIREYIVAVKVNG